MHATRTFHISRLILAIAFASIPAALAAQPAPSPGVPDFHMKWTVDAVGGGEWPMDAPGVTGVASRFLDIHYAGETDVDIDLSFQADPFFLTGTWDSLETWTTTYECGAHPTAVFTRHVLYATLDSGSQPRNPVFIAVATAPDGSLYVRDPFELSGGALLAYPSTYFDRTTGSGADCFGPISTDQTITLPADGVPPTFLPGDIPADNEAGTHFSRDSYLTYYVDPYNLVPVVFHFHVEITDLHECSVEICDGLDNDCDTFIDEGTDGVACDGPDADLCDEGVTVCQGVSGLICSDPNDFNSEVCDGADNDCNPATADGSGEADFGAACDGIDADKCLEGTWVCTGGPGLSCDDPNDPDPDTCDALDNDCDPATADGSSEPDFGTDCDGSDVDLCLEGKWVCTGGPGLTCNDLNDADPDMCDGFDNDCNPATADGSAEEDFEADCDGTDTDLCLEGTWICTGGPGLTCNDLNDADPDMCDGFDNDCNPVTADGSGESDFGTACDGADLDLCLEGAWVCTGGPGLTCNDGNDADPDLCDGLDNDCNPATADGSAEPALGSVCDGTDADLCPEGILVCSGIFGLACSDLNDADPEICDGIDNDCDGSVDEGGVCGVAPLLTSLSPAKVWVGLESDTDAGIRFDLAAKIYLNDVEVGSGQLDSVAGGSSGFENAKFDSVKLNLSAPVSVPPGSPFRIEILVRNACRKSGKNSGRATLWYNGQAIDRGPRADAGSRFDASIGGAKQDYFLRGSAALSTTPGTSRLATNQDAGSPCSAFKSFGTWTTTLP